MLFVSNVNSGTYRMTPTMIGPYPSHAFGNFSALDLTGTLIPKAILVHREGRSAHYVRMGVLSRNSKSNACKRELRTRGKVELDQKSGV